MLAIDANVFVAAFDARDRFHEGSTAFLRAAARGGEVLCAPTFVLLETACALARRARDPAVGALAAARLRTHPALVLLPLDEPLLTAAEGLGVRQLLRGADALYVAAAALRGAVLVSWDADLLERGGAITPEAWLAARA